MIKSSLATEVYEAHENNYEKGRRGYKICKFTPHIMAGILTARQCGVNVFQKSNRYASANYGIGNDGEIACYVGEENRSYASYSASNDCQAVTVEVSNCEIGGEWRISEKAWNSLVKLAVDVCRRNGFRLVYDGTPNGSLTRHNMFINTTCPGPYLQSRFQELADTVNAILDGQAPAESGQNTAESPVESGQKAGKIADIQSTLNSRYGFNIAVDNIYGSETHTALVKALQTELNKQFNAGLVVDRNFWTLHKECLCSCRKRRRRKHYISNSSNANLQKL
jgi:N-acetyl-anhydromuramyl-L-alanine amidase AmpD